MTLRRVLFLMSDTGGGHRAAAMAIQAAMEMNYPEQYCFQMVDVFRNHTPFPFKTMPEFYPIWVNRSSLSWKLGYKVIDGRYRSRWILDAFYLLWRPGLRRVFTEYPADVVVCVHSLFNRAALRAVKHAGNRPPPFVTVITDLVTTPASGYQHDADLCLVPTPQAYERGLKMGMRPDQMKLTGLPVHPNFVQGLSDKQEARAMLGWDSEKLAVLVVSGGDAMGPVLEIVRGINEQGLDIQLAIIAGRNESLQHKLNQMHWKQPTHIYPFVDYMARLMTAADILITKAGPATISEACVAGLPMILSGKVPGQEDGNVTMVVENGAGVYAGNPRQVAEDLVKWVGGPRRQLAAYSQAAYDLARPDAAWAIADEIHQITENPPLHVTPPTRASWSLLFPGVRPSTSNPPKKLL